MSNAGHETSPDDSWIAEHDDPNDHPDAIDPDDVPADVDELYVGPGTTSRRRYHRDPECTRLRATNTRRPEIAASWYPPCRYCVTGEFPPDPDDEGDDGAE